MNCVISIRRCGSVGGFGGWVRSLPPPPPSAAAVGAQDLQPPFLDSGHKSNKSVMFGSTPFSSSSSFIGVECFAQVWFDGGGMAHTQTPPVMNLEMK